MNSQIGEWRLWKVGGRLVGRGCIGLDGLVVEEEDYRGLEGRQSGGLAPSNCQLAVQCAGNRLMEVSEGLY